MKIVKIKPEEEAKLLRITKYKLKKGKQEWNKEFEE